MNNQNELKFNDLMHIYTNLMLTHILNLMHRQHSKPIERKLLCILSVFLETHPPQAVRGRCRFIKIKIAETYAKIKKIYIYFDILSHK
jgi:hypothetical protein